MSEKITKFLRGQVITSILYILIGSAFVFMPVESVNIVSKIVFGIILILSGIYHIIFYLLDKPTTTVMDLFSGVILVVFGIFLFNNPQIIVKLLPTLLGGIILVDCVWTIRGGFRLKKAGSRAWKWLLLCSLVFLGLGAAMILNPFKVVRYSIIFCGSILIANGVLDLIFQLVVHYGMKHSAEKNSNVDTQPANPEPISDTQETVYTDWNQREEESVQDHSVVQNTDPAKAELPNTDSAEPAAQQSDSEAAQALDSVAEEKAQTEISAPELTLEPDLTEKKEEANE